MIKYIIGKNSKHSAFSLIEILMSLLIVSLIFVAMAPVLTKRIIPQKDSGVVYTYQGPSNLTYQNSCFITNVDFEDGDFDETYYSSKDCSEYKFTVPSGISRVNLTLVAGGGGGGGAAGGLEQVSTIATGTQEDIYTTNTNPDLVKNIKVAYLAANGKDGAEAYFGGNASNNSCETTTSGTKSGYCGGKGGDSSPVIYDFNIPKEYLRGLNFTNVLSTQNPVDGSYSVSNQGSNAQFNISWGDFAQNKTIAYGINNVSDSYELFCSMGNNRYLSDNVQFSNICQIPTNNILKSAEGSFGTHAASGDSTNVNVNTIYKGGPGGQVSLALGHYGAGGEGQGFQITKCPQSSNYGQSCNIENANFTRLNIDNEDGSINEIRKGKIGNASVVITTERPGGAGGGGAAGAVVKINNLQVVPNQTYTIVVGSGGVGGIGGVASASPSGGINGLGGTSSAIYDNQGNLIYMVNGGAPGEGGKVWNASSGYSGENGLSGRNYKMLISGNTNYFTSLAMDDRISSNIAAVANAPDFKNENGTNVAGINVRRLVYSALQSEPYMELNIRENENNSYTGNLANKTGGFSGFNTASVDVANSKYDGFYYRGLLNNTGAYIGGLGGFSGLGNKAGCGGFFMGNFDGRQDKEGTLPNNDITRQNNLNTFTIDNISYKVTDYYENCSMNSPDGQSAEFIDPKPNSSFFGSAGSGGGGGGYNIQLGSGKGGNGQNGYVMIEWRK